MILNPQVLVDRGVVSGEGLEVQQNGIDLTLKSVKRLMGHAKIRKDGTDHCSHQTLDTDEDGMYHLEAGKVYMVDSGQYVEMPENAIAQVIQRSSLNRNGNFIMSSIYDSGFNGVIGFAIYCFHDIFIEQGARVGQIVFQQAEAASQYDGQYQDKNPPIK